MKSLIAQLRPGLLIALIGLLTISCVPQRKFQDLESRFHKSETDNERLRAERDAALARSENLQRQVRQLHDDTTRMGLNLIRTQVRLEQLQATYEQTLAYNQQLLDGKAEETRQILARLQATQADLQRQEDELGRTARELAEKEQNLERLLADLQGKEQRVNELESILQRQDSVVNALRHTVSSALLGFQDNGLSVDIRHGKVYVSLEESLLFATGSTTVDRQGENALRELARVLERNPDINIMIEGHTDDVPLRSGSLMKDNWDLSVLRATSILRILSKHGNIDPRRFIAAGRGEFLPIEEGSSPEARRKNRRTEIILTPQLDELFRIIEMN